MLQLGASYKEGGDVLGNNKKRNKKKGQKKMNQTLTIGYYTAGLGRKSNEAPLSRDGINLWDENESEAAI